MPRNSLIDRFRAAWNVFSNDPQVPYKYEIISDESTGRRTPTYPSSRESVVGKIYTQISTDVANVAIRHVKLDKSGRYTEDIHSSLNECLTLRANVDQTYRAFIQDIVLTMFTEGSAAIVPVDTDMSPVSSAGYDILTMRVGSVVTWYARAVRVRVYNDRTGHREEITVPKERVAVVLNPLYEVMNRPNNDLKRLLEKIRTLDQIESRSASGKLDIIVQLPYTVKSDLQQKRAKDRIANLEDQLANSQHGIAWFDSTEKITQLNRPAENTLLEQITSLTKDVYNALGLTEEIISGTATEEQQLQYFNRTVRPILEEICTAMTSTFLSVKARTMGQRIQWFRDPFASIPMGTFAQTATAFIGSQVLTSNEIRAVLGYAPSEETQADSLANPAINPVDSMGQVSAEEPPEEDPPFDLDLDAQGEQ